MVKFTSLKGSKTRHDKILGNVEDRFLNFPVPFIFERFLSNQTIDLAAQFSNPEQKVLKLDWSVFHLAVEVNVVKAILAMLNEFKEQVRQSNKAWHVPILAKALCLTRTWIPNRKRTKSILDPYFREIREIRHFRPSKKSCAFANVLQLIALLTLQVSANVNSCCDMGMTDFSEERLWLSELIATSAFIFYLFIYFLSS